MQCIQCKKEYIIQNNKTRNTKYCSVKCRNKVYYEKYQKDWQINKRNNEAKNPKGKVQCFICNGWYIQVGTHIVQIHGITAREYREDFELEVKKGITPEWYREKKGKQALENKTYKNLEIGKKFWFKKGDEKAGKYKRSQITIEKLKNLYKLTKKYKKHETS